MATCAEHPDREASFKCLKCTEYFCDECVSNSPGRAYCNNCSKAINRRAANYHHASITPFILFGSILSVAVGLYLLFENADAFQFPLEIMDPKFMEKIAAFFATDGAQRMAFAIAAMPVYFALGVGIMANRRWALYAGLLLNAGVFYALFNLPSIAGVRTSNLDIALLTLLTVALIFGRKNLDI
ncbi:Uncharacterised protein [uncultured archaeon]|nr:Uncharacterised protein [uncultured archaeon]